MKASGFWEKLYLFLNIVPFKGDALGIARLLWRTCMMVRYRTGRERFSSPYGAILSLFRCAVCPITLTEHMWDNISATISMIVRELFLSKNNV